MKKNNSFKERKLQEARARKTGGVIEAADNELPVKYRGSWLSLWVDILKSGKREQIEKQGGIRMQVQEGDNVVQYDLNAVFIKSKCFEELLAGQFNIEQCRQIQSAIVGRAFGTDIDAALVQKARSWEVMLEELGGYKEQLEEWFKGGQKDFGGSGLIIRK